MKRGDLNAKILVLFGGGFPTHLQTMYDEFKRLNEPVLFSNYKEINFETDHNQKKPKLYLDDIDFKQFKIIFFRLIGSRWEIINLINNYLLKEIKANKVRLIDTIAATEKRYLGLKIPQMFVLKQTGLPVPKTIYTHFRYLKKTARKSFNYPFIIKSSGGSGGKEVYLVKDNLDLKQKLLALKKEQEQEDKRFFAQEFIPNVGDYRVLVLGNKVLGAIKRVRQSDDFRNNVCLGGKALVAQDLDESLKKIAIKAVKTVQLDFAGVDIVVRETDGQPFIFEVNRGPQFNGFQSATGIDVGKKLAHYLMDLKKKLV